MQRAFVYKLRPSKAQIRALTDELGAHRALYNAALEQRRTAWDRGMGRFRIAGRAVVTDSHGQPVTAEDGTPRRRGFGYVQTPEAEAMRKRVSAATNYVAQNHDLTRLRREDPTYGARSSSAQQRTLRRLDKAFAAFFRRVKEGGTPGYPRFKGANRFDSVEFTAGNGARVDVEAKRAYFHGIGAIKVRFYRPIEGRIKSIAFKHRASGWWLICSCELPDPTPEPATGPAVGIDVGLRAWLMTSDGEAVPAPRHYERALKRLRRRQRTLARRKPGSGRRRQARQQLARQHERIAQQRLDWQYKQARRLVQTYGAIAHEALHVAAMVRTGRPTERYPWAKRGLNRGAHDAAWAQFLTILTRRGEETGVAIVPVPAEYTTQECSRCGTLADPPISIFERVRRCQACGYEVDQDESAATVILQRARLAGAGNGDAP